MQQLAEERADRQYQEQMAYQQQRDAVADMQHQQSLAAEKQEADRSLALQLLRLGYNTEQIARTLGLGQAQIAAMLNGQKETTVDEPVEVTAGELDSGRVLQADRILAAAIGSGDRAKIEQALITAYSIGGLTTAQLRQYAAKYGISIA